MLTFTYMCLGGCNMLVTVVVRLGLYMSPLGVVCNLTYCTVPRPELYR
jgi:hypothetical protein